MCWKGRDFEIDHIVEKLSLSLLLSLSQPIKIQIPGRPAHNANSYIANVSSLLTHHTWASPYSKRVPIRCICFASFLQWVVSERAVEELSGYWRRLDVSSASRYWLLKD